jgi:FtsP/CotA-like multicopper oxidase with cupredoxin domain
MGQLFRAFLLRGIAIAFVFAIAGHVFLAHAQNAGANIDLAVRPEFSEPVTLASKDGVLEVRLTAHQGRAKLDTVADPVENFLVFAYQIIRGTASNGAMSDDNLYPAPTLQAYPGETLIVHLDNALTGLTIRDYFDPKYIAKGEKVPLQPEQMTASPINLHVHGVHVSPKGNADNVMLHIAPGMSNTYTYQIPKICRRVLIGTTAISTRSRRRKPIMAWPATCDRAHRWKHSTRNGKSHPDPQHGAAV